MRRNMPEPVTGDFECFFTDLLATDKEWAIDGRLVDWRLEEHGAGSPTRWECSRPPTPIRSIGSATIE